MELVTIIAPIAVACGSGTCALLGYRIIAGCLAALAIFGAIAIASLNMTAG